MGWRVVPPIDNYRYESLATRPWPDTSNGADVGINPAPVVHIIEGSSSVFVWPGINKIIIVRNIELGTPEV